MSGSDELAGLPSYFRDNPWVEVLTQRGQEDEAGMSPVKAPEASGDPTLSTAAEPAQVSPGPSQPSQALSGQELQQLISSLTKLVQCQFQMAHAQANAQPTVMVIPVVVQVPVPYPWPIQAQGYEIGGCGGVLCTPRYIEERSAKPLARRPPGFKSRPRRQRKAQSGCRAQLHTGGETPAFSDESIFPARSCEAL